jgi:hypothetical protein
LLLLYFPADIYMRSLSTLTLFRTGWLVGIEPTCVWAHVPGGEIVVLYLNATFMIPKQNLRINRSCCFCLILIIYITYYLKSAALLLTALERQ